MYLLYQVTKTTINFQNILTSQLIILLTEKNLKRDNQKRKKQTTCRNKPFFLEKPNDLDALIFNEIQTCLDEIKALRLR